MLVTRKPNAALFHTVYWKPTHTNQYSNIVNQINILTKKEKLLKPYRSDPDLQTIRIGKGD